MSHTRYSSEVRWFLQGSAPPEVLDWFDRPGHQIKQPPRIDYYAELRNCGEASVKLSRERLEFKALCRPVPSTVELPGAMGVQNHWVKWSCPLAATGPASYELPRGAWLAVWKSRSLRLYAFDADDPESGATVVDPELSTPECGCEVELTTLRLLRTDSPIHPLPDARWDEAAQWWSYAFEAFGDPALNPHYLWEAARAELQQTPPASFALTMSCAYPAWLVSHADGA